MNEYDALIRVNVARLFPELQAHFGPEGWLWVKAQMWQESRMNPNAVSPVGAKGLLQLMPGTAREMGVADAFNPAQNIRGGVMYLAEQYRKLGEIPVYLERLRAALACYNGGRGYVNMALALGREACGLPYGYGAWTKAGKPAGWWQTWALIARMLASPRCIVKGRRPDHKQMVDYVAKIEGRFFDYLKA